MKIRISIVDDHNLYRKGVIQIFEQHEFAENGASGYLLKSASVEELGDAIREVYHNGFYFNEFLANETVVELVQNKKINPIFKETIKLTQREREVAELICAQLSYKEIANKLGISKRTVESHKNHILEKIGATKVTGIVVYAAKKGWV